MRGNGARPRRIELDPEDIERGVVELVLAVVELIRQLLEKQALRRVEGGSLTPWEVERLGTALMRLEAQMETLKAHFGIEDLNIDLGPLGTLLDEGSTTRAERPAPNGAILPRRRSAGGDRW